MLVRMWTTGLILASARIPCALPGRADPTGHLPVAVERFFPRGPSSRGGGTSSIGDARFERVVRKDEQPLLRLTTTRRSGRGAWWFPNHRELQLGELSADPTIRLHLRMRSRDRVGAVVSAQWMNKDREKGEPVPQRVALSPDEWTDLLLPLPPSPPGDAAARLVLRVAAEGVFEVSQLGLVALRRARLHPIPRRILFAAKQVEISGEAGSGVATVSIRVRTSDRDGDQPVLHRKLTCEDGRFATTLAKRDLQPYRTHRITAQADGFSGTDSRSQPVEVFAFPDLTAKQAPRVCLEGGKLMCGGRPFGFVGVNYTRFQLGLSIRSDFEAIARDLRTLADWGVRVVRMPLNFGLIQPAEGVFPDNSRWRQIYEDHRLDPAFVEQIDYFIALAGQLGIYTIVDWHGAPTNPFRHFLGGKAQLQGTGKPGRAIAWLAPSPAERVPLDMGNLRHRQALVASHRWTAAHFRGNPNILGFEVPFNEPHCAFMSTDENWRRVTDACARAVKLADPNRLTFAMAPAYGHANTTMSATWRRPDRVDGLAPHFYLANGPVPLRTDAKQYRHPWLARDVNATFSHATPAVLLPFSAVNCPIYNGENGEHGLRELLPDLPPQEAAEAMIEAGLFQGYAAGFVGYVQWTLWGYRQGFVPYREIYARLFRRFAPVYRAGPVDWSRAEVAFIQNPAAVPIANGHNFACVPAARLMLDLHIAPVHYLTDDQFLCTGLVEFPKGLEQVAEASPSLRYKAIVCDRRNLDQRVVRTLSRSDLPILWIDDMERLTADELAELLTGAGIHVDRRTPAGIQYVRGPKHLLVYRRVAAEPDEVTIFPRLDTSGVFRLRAEGGAIAFQGLSADLVQKGLRFSLPKWRSAIFAIES